MMVDIIAIQKLDITPLETTLRLMQASRNSDSARMACTMNSPILMSASFLPACSSVVLDLSELMLLSVGRASGISTLTSPLRFIVCIFCTCYQPGPFLLGCHSLNRHPRPVPTDIYPCGNNRSSHS